MLVLTRKRGEEIIIGEDITAMVLAVEGDRVKLGITAPADVPIYREELVVKMGRLPVSEYAACS